LRLPLVGDDAVGEPARLGVKIVAPAAEPLVEPSSVEGTQVLDHADAVLVELRLGLRADAGNDADAHRSEKGLDFVRRHDGQAVGLLEVRGDLRHELVGAQTDRAPDTLAFDDLALERPRALDRRLEAPERREVQIGLVDARLLEGIAYRRDDRHHSLRHLHVEPAVAVDESHRLLAPRDRCLRQLPRPRDGHRRAGAVAPRGVAGGPDDAAAPALLPGGADAAAPVAE